uniref:CRAL-TRIO domain-containing protein n=1 Tax=Rhizochromulina marina TaxID=1034831 RepID=A0A7S2R4C5_9STRA
MAALVEDPAQASSASASSSPHSGGAEAAGVAEGEFPLPWFMKGKMEPEELRARLGVLQAKYPDVAPGILWRFLLGRKGVVEKAQAMFEEHLVWKAAHIPVDFRSCRDELEKKKLYFNGEDVDGNPVLYFRSSKQDPQTRDIDASMRMVVYTLESKFNSLPETGQITVFIDREGATKKNFDPELLKLIASSLGNNYPERMARTVVYPTGLVFRGIWMIAKMFLDPVTAKKVHLCGSIEDVTQHIAPANLPRRMGGTLPDEPAYYPWQGEDQSGDAGQAEA